MNWFYYTDHKEVVSITKKELDQKRFVDEVIHIINREKEDGSKEDVLEERQPDSKEAVRR